MLLRDMSGLKAQLTRVTRDAELAADLLQDAIVTALQKLEAGEIEHRGQLDGYVYRVALKTEHGRITVDEPETRKLRAR